MHCGCRPSSAVTSSRDTKMVERIRRLSSGNHYAGFYLPLDPNEIMLDFCEFRQQRTVISHERFIFFQGVVHSKDYSHKLMFKFKRV